MKSSLSKHGAKALVIGSLLAAMALGAAPVKLLNASFDISRELFEKYNPVFAQHWKEQGGGEVTVSQSHGGSTKQARSVLDGLEADVVTFNQETDIRVLAKSGGPVAADWQERFPNHSAPYTSTIVFLVRKGNPKNLKDWDDLVKPGISVVVPNPKTSGNGRYSYLAAYGYALQKFNQDQAKARAFVAQLFKNAPVLDTGGRGATTTFAQRETGDVLLTFEAEAFLALKEFGADKFQVVLPSLSIEAEMPVAVVDKVAKKHGTTKEAKAYLEYLYAEPAQEIIARSYFRPSSAAVAKKYATQFGSLQLFSVEKVFGGWEKAQAEHFADGGSFDQIYHP